MLNNHHNARFLGLDASTAITVCYGGIRGFKTESDIYDLSRNTKGGGNKLGYFNLKLKPNTEKTLKIKVFNPTNKPIKVKVSAKDAQTADDGRIDYLSDDPVSKQLLPEPGGQYVHFKLQVVVPANTQKWVNVNVKMPDTAFKGKKAFAINLAAMGPTGGSINNRYVYAVGVTLNGRKLPRKELHHLQMPTMQTGFVDKKAALQFKVNNPDPIFSKRVNYQPS